MRAYLKNYRQSPRKVRVVAAMLRGKPTREADQILRVVGKRAAGPLRKLLASAVANAKHNDKADPASLVVSRVRVDKGVVLKRGMPRAQGRTTPVHKHTSNVLLTLAVKSPEKVAKRGRPGKRSKKQ